MGHCALYLGNYTGAITNFKKALELDPEITGALRDLGLAYLLNGEYDKALENMGRGVFKNPDEMSYYNLAFLHHLKGNQGLALKFFKKSQELYPTILGLGSIFVDNTPASSPTKKFFQEQLTTAKMYLGAQKTPAAITTEKQKPSLKITDLSLEPDPVKGNKPFDIVADFKIDIPDGKKQIPILLYFTISQNNKILFKSDTYTINADNSKVSNWTRQMNPVSAKGVYIIKVFVSHKKLLTEKTIKLIIN
jgi:tetratricopeptide (TPR) repeat protein